MSESALTGPYRPSLRLSRQDWWLVIAAFLLSRIALYGFGYAGVHLYGNPQLGPFQAYCQFDCVWFMRIIENGYDLYPRWLSKGNAANWAFMPLYPMLSGGLSKLIGGDTLTALMLVANTAFFFALPAMLLVMRQIKMDEETARFGVWLLAFSPFSAYFVSGYGESMFMLFMLLMFLFAYRQQWLLVGLIGILISSTRNLGVMMVFPVLILALQAYGWREFFRFTENAFKVVLTLWLIPLGLFSYMFYLYHLTGDALAFKHIQVAWGRAMDSPLDWWISGFELGGRKMYLSIMVMFGWALNLWLFSQKRWAEATLMVICCTIPLMTGLNAMPRYMFGLYPTLLAIILFSRRWPALRPAILCLSGMVASFIAVAFVNAKFFTV
ncbi:hypothetical protein [Aeromonas simiae]|uniref:Glycosyltransferase RgtA/B/C/D-like domain-containing protein n=1 Tax=Aeromonas simiae TaxID=218936 RepID=A0A5J6WVS9_9GAMM|nr:hypothetical protein [Aeromonas simiae]QFI53803.1 hypothetical protein FE240_03220 [Aeromonas simiae]